MEFKFDLSESKIEGIKYYGKLIFGDDEDESITVDITVRENEGELYVCYPSKYSNKDDKYYATVYLGKDLYEKVNKKLNKQFNKKNK